MRQPQRYAILVTPDDPADPDERAAIIQAAEAHGIAVYVHAPQLVPTVLPHHALPIAWRTNRAYRDPLPWLDFFSAFTPRHLL